MPYYDFFCHTCDRPFFAALPEVANDFHSCCCCNHCRFVCSQLD